MLEGVCGKNNNNIEVNFKNAKNINTKKFVGLDLTLIRKKIITFLFYVGGFGWIKRRIRWCLTRIEKVRKLKKISCNKLQKID